MPTRCRATARDSSATRGVNCRWSQTQRRAEEQSPSQRPIRSPDHRQRSERRGCQRRQGRGGDPGPTGYLTAAPLDKWGKTLVEWSPKNGPLFPRTPGETVIAYIWANVVSCPRTGGPVPLVQDKWLRKQTGKEAAVRFIPRHTRQPPPRLTSNCPRVTGRQGGRGPRLRRAGHWREPL